MEENFDKDEMIAVLTASIDQLMGLFFQEDQSRLTESLSPVTPQDHGATQTPTESPKHSEQADGDFRADDDKLIPAKHTAKKKGGRKSFKPPKQPERRRRKFNASEQALLEAEFQKNAQWSYELTQILSERLGVKRLKIYKWNYDRQQREAQLQLHSLCDLMDHGTTLDSLP